MERRKYHTLTSGWGTQGRKRISLKRYSRLNWILWRTRFTVGTQRAQLTSEMWYTIYKTRSMMTLFLCVNSNLKNPIWYKSGHGQETTIEFLKMIRGRYNNNRLRDSAYPGVSVIKWAPIFNYDVNIILLLINNSKIIFPLYSSTKCLSRNLIGFDWHLNEDELT